MGWDLYAVTVRGKRLDIEHGKSPEEGMYLKNPTLRKAFEQAKEDALKKTPQDYIDWMLNIGALDCSDCAIVLEEVTPLDIWAEKFIPPKEVKEAFETADWESHPNKNWAYWSAYYFLKTCVVLGLGVLPSY